MTWNITAEWMSGLVVLIIFIYSRKGILLPTLKNQIFRVCLIVTIGAIAFNIASTLLLAAYPGVSDLFVHAATMMYFFLTPLMGLVYYFYTIVFLYEFEEKKASQLMLLGAAPYVIYGALVLLNPFFGTMYTLSPTTGYARGWAISATYLVFYFYCAMCAGFAIKRRHHVETVIWRILLSFPIIAVLVVLLQAVLPSYILTGSAGCCSLLIIYLYLQNKQFSIDALTGLSNRVELLRALGLRLREGKPFCVLVLSLNEFKLVNDKAGSSNGDRFLQQIASYLRHLVEFQRLYRYSGDEFAIILNEKEHHRADALIAALRARFRTPWVSDNYHFMLPYSIGVIEYPETADSMDDIMSGLECALETAKRERGLCRCTQEMLRQVARKQQIEEILKISLAEGGFEIFLQPIYSPSQDCFLLAESLLRLNHTPIGPIYPDEFIPIAEETGLIIDITYWVLTRVCAITQEWLQSGKVFRGIAVNLSAVQFMQEDFLDQICAIIERAGVPFAMIKFEVTESVLISNYETVKSFMGSMCARGCRFGLDDFGTGYSNLSTMLMLPFDTIKLDKSLVWLAESDKRFGDVVRHLTTALQNNGINVLAEGVENEAQAQFIRACGCNYIQGYHYARPMPPEQAKALF